MTHVGTGLTAPHGKLIRIYMPLNTYTIVGTTVLLLLLLHTDTIYTKSWRNREDGYGYRARYGRWDRTIN